MGKTNLWALLTYVTLMIMITEVESRLYRVGDGKYTWKPNINLSEWATHQRFYSGDWLLFGFDLTRHTVLQVNQYSYERCIETDYIFNVTHRGQDAFKLLQPIPYYFICGRGYCNEGMKIAVNVLPPLLPSTPTVYITPTSTANTLIPSNVVPAIATTILIFKALYLV